MITTSMRFRDTIRWIFTIVLFVTLVSSQDLTALGKETIINHDDIGLQRTSSYQLEEDASRIILRETISSADNNVYVIFIKKLCYIANILKRKCIFLRTYKSYDQMRNNTCEKNIVKKCNYINYFLCHYPNGNLKYSDSYSSNRENIKKSFLRECQVCAACWNYTYIDAKCNLPTIRIVKGSIICEFKPVSFRKSVSLAKIDLTTGKIILQRPVDVILAFRGYLSKNKDINIDIEIMIDNAKIWILYNGLKYGILEQLNLKSLSPVKTIYVDRLNNDNRAIVVSNKLYVLSISGDQLSINRAIDTNNSKNKMSRKVTLLENFEHGKKSWVHYNPRLGQLFTGNIDQKRFTQIYEVEKCAYAYPKHIDLDKLPVQSTFLWSFYPNNDEYYQYIIQKMTSFLKIKNHKHLNTISNILLSCPYTKCRHTNSSDDPYCRLKDIRSLFESFVMYKDPTFSIPLQLHFDMVKLLEQRQFREISNKINGLQNLINRNFIDIKKEIRQLRSTMGSYFTALANFDSKKSKSDLELFYSIYNDLRKRQNKISLTINRKLNKLFRQATESNIAENAGQLANVAIASAAFVNPFSFFDSTDKVLQLQDRLADAAKAIVDTVKLDKINKVYFPRLRKLGDDIRPKVISMSRVFPNIKLLINKAIYSILNAKQLAEYVDVFLKEYDSYKPAFEPSTIDEYEAVLSEIVNELCRIIYEGKSLAAAVAQGVLASKGTCLATKIDVQTLMGLYRDMYDKQKILLDSFASAMRATAARVNAERIRDIPNQIHTRKFIESETNYKLSALEMLINSMIHTLLITREACTLITYKNGDVMPGYCRNAIDNGGITDSLISSRLNRDMCDGVNIRKFVYIPAQQQSIKSSMPNGTIDLTRLYRGEEVTFQIPNTDWLIEHKWINGDEKDKMIVLKEFGLYIPANSSSEIYVKSKKRFLSQNIIKPGGNNYELSATQFYQYNFAYSQGTFQCIESMLPSTPYELPSCPKLPKICVTCKGKISHPTVYPSIYSKFGITLSKIGNIQEPHPKTMFYLMASVTLCIVEPIATKRKRSQSVANTVVPNRQVRTYSNKRSKSPVCCGKNNKYYDPLSVENLCKPCPKISTARFHGLYCD